MDRAQPRSDPLIGGARRQVAMAGEMRLPTTAPEADESGRFHRLPKLPHHDPLGIAIGAGRVYFGTDHE